MEEKVNLEICLLSSFSIFFFKKSFPNAFDELRTVPQPQHCDKQLTFLTFFGSGEKVANTFLWELIYLESVELYIIVAVKLSTGLATGAQIPASLLSCSANVSSTENFHFLGKKNIFFLGGEQK